MPGSRDRSRARSAGAGAPAFTPDRNGLILWHESGAPYVTTPGGAVSQKNDRSVSASNATQGTAGNRPAHSLTSAAGRPGITYDGTDDYLAQPLSMPAGAKSVGVAFDLTATPGGSTFKSLIRLKGGTLHFELLVFNFATYQNVTFFSDYVAAGGVASGIGPTLDTNPHTVIVVYNGGSPTAQASYACYLDGNPWPVVASNTVNAHATAIGTLGGRANGSGFEGQAAPVIMPREVVYSRALAQYEVIRAHEYLGRAFAAAATWTPQVVCDGNSLTVGFPGTEANSYPGQLRTSLGGPGAWGVWNLGVNGQTTADMIADFGTQVAPLYNGARSKNVLVAFEVGNDLLGNATARDAVDRLWAYCDLARAAGFYVIACNVPKRSDLAGAKETARAAANVLIAAEYASHAGALANLADRAEFSNTADGTYYTDGVHYTTAGYGVVRDVVLPLVQAA